MKKPASLILTEAADLLEPEGAWVQRSFAKGPEGQSYPQPEAECSWCALGAILKASGGVRAAAGGYHDAVLFLRQVHGFQHTVFWNDAPDRTQAEVVQAIRDAAALALEKENPNG